MSDISNKDYRRPDGLELKDPKRPWIHNHGDYVFYENFVAFVLPHNSEQNTPEPTKRWFAISDSRPINAGDDILVDLQNGKSQEAKVVKKEGRVLFLQYALPDYPKMTGEVRKIIGTRSTQIDTRFDLDVQKGRDAFARYENKTDEVKQLIANELHKKNKENFKERYRPGENPLRNTGA